MKTILSVALVFGFGGFTVAADNAEVVGTWKCEYKIGDQKRTSTLTIKNDGDKLAGTMTWPGQEAKLSDVGLEDNKLTFSAERQVMNNKYKVEYTLTADGDKLQGKGAVENAGKKTEFEIQGKREPTDK